MYVQNPNVKLVYFDKTTGELKLSRTGIPSDDDIGIFMEDLVIETGLTGIEVVSVPTMTTVMEGDYYDFTGLKVMATYEDGTNRELREDEYELTATRNGEPTDAHQASTGNLGGDVVFAVSYGDFEVEDAFTITVTPQL